MAFCSGFTRHCVYKRKWGQRQNCVKRFVRFHGKRGFPFSSVEDLSSNLFWLECFWGAELMYQGWHCYGGASWYYPCPNRWDWRAWLWNNNTNNEEGKTPPGGIVMLGPTKSLWTDADKLDSQINSVGKDGNMGSIRR